METKMKPDHNPIIQGIWIPFKGFYFENEWYNVRTKRGSVYLTLRAKKDLFFKPGISVKAEDIAHICLCQDAETPEVALKASRRVWTVMNTYGVIYPVYIRRWDRFVDISSLSSVQAIKPTATVAYRDPKGHGGTYTVIGEGFIVKREGTSPVVLPIEPDNLWKTDREMVLMPNTYRHRVEEHRIMQAQSVDVSIVAREIRKYYGALPIELIDTFASRVLSEGKLRIVNGKCDYRGYSFRELVEPHIRDHIRLMENHILHHTPARSKTQVYYLHRLREVLR